MKPCLGSAFQMGLNLCSLHSSMVFEDFADFEMALRTNFYAAGERVLGLALSLLIGDGNGGFWKILERSFIFLSASLSK